jgi:hypothetical protein
MNIFMRGCRYISISHRPQPPTYSILIKKYNPVSAGGQGRQEAAAAAPHRTARLNEQQSCVAVLDGARGRGPSGGRHVGGVRVPASRDGRRGRAWALCLCAWERALGRVSSRLERRDRRFSSSSTTTRTAPKATWNVTTVSGGVCFYSTYNGPKTKSGISEFLDSGTLERANVCLRQNLKCILGRSAGRGVGLGLEWSGVGPSVEYVRVRTHARALCPCRGTDSAALLGWC